MLAKSDSVRFGSWCAPRVEHNKGVGSKKVIKCVSVQGSLRREDASTVPNMRVKWGELHIEVSSSYEKLTLWDTANTVAET